VGICVYVLTNNDSMQHVCNFCILYIKQCFYQHDSNANFTYLLANFYVYFFIFYDLSNEAVSSSEYILTVPDLRK
jgi:hypothetical protein